MLTKFVHEGQAVDYTPSSDVAAGDVIVQGVLLGVARCAIKAGANGALAVAGVFDFPKAIGQNMAVAAGVTLFWDAQNKVATTDSYEGNRRLIGKATAAAGDNDTTVRVRLTQ